MITYDEIYNRMKSEFSAKSKYDFDEASDAAIRMRVLAGEIFNAMTNIEWLKNQMFVATASGEYLDYLHLKEDLSVNRRRKRRVKLHSLSMNLLKTAFLFLKEVWSLRQIPSR